MKKRHELPREVDPATTRYIDQLLGKQPAFEHHDAPMAATTAQQKFLQAYNTNGGITRQALKTAGITRAILDEWRQKDPDFKKDFEEIQTHWVEELRRTAFLRATAKSDVLLMFLLKSMQPEVFDDDIRKQQHVGIINNKDAIPVRATLVRDNTFNMLNVNIDPDKAAEIRKILELEPSNDSNDSSDPSDSSDSSDSGDPNF